MDTGENTFTLNGHEEDVRSVAFGPDGRRFVSQDVGGKKIIWDSQTGKRLKDEAPADELLQQSFGPDGLGRVIRDGEKLLFTRDNPQVNLWAEYAARRKATAHPYHTEAAERAEADEHWFAARFHLHWLVENSPKNDELNQWLERAEEAWTTTD